MDLDSDLEGDILDEVDLDSPDIEFINDGIVFGQQKAILFSKYLPYADRIEKESETLLAAIKANLGKAVFYRELKPGCYFWVNQLTWYIHQYGRKFSKEDHIVFIKLMYELVTIPDLEFFLLDNFSRVLTTLLRKKELLSRKDLTLDWRPLYEVYSRVAFNKWERHGLMRIPTASSLVVNQLIRSCRVYFSVDSTQEILEEFRPMICPFIPKQMGKAIELLELFLPTTLFPEEHKQGFQLWFNELMQMWESVQVIPNWEANMVFLFSRLAEANIGYIDWTPHIPMLFTRLLRSFHLPLQIKSLRFQSAREHYNISAVAVFLVSMLGGNEVCQNHLTRLFTSIESFYHPSNYGFWNARLQQFLAKLSEAFVKRLRIERRIVKTWETEIPSSHRLTENNITDFVNSMKRCVLLSMFAKSGCADARVALKNLASLRPELIIPEVLERFYPAIDTLNEPHRLLAVVQCATSVSPCIVDGGKFNPNVPTNVLPIMISCLPGIDPNDFQKTLVTFHLLVNLIILVPFVDCTPCLQESNDLTELEKELCSASSQFEDFVLQFLDRCFILVENASTFASLSNDCTAVTINHEDEYVLNSVSIVFNLIMNQSSTSIRKSAVEKLCNFVTSRILGIKDAGPLAGKLINAAVHKTDAEFILRKLLNKVCSVIDEICSDASADSTEVDKELLYNMLLLQELVCCDGRLLLSYRSTLLKTLRKIVLIEEKDGRNITCSIIRNILKSLTTTYLLEQRSGNEPYDISPDKEIPIKKWGATMKVDDIKINWHTGDDEEIAFAQELVDEFLTEELNRLSNLMNGAITLTREQLQKSLALIHAILLGCLYRCPLWQGSTVPLTESCTNLDVPSYCFYKENAAMLHLKGENLRESILRWLHTFVEYAQNSNHEDNIPAIAYLTKMFHHLLFYWGALTDTLRRERKSWSGICKSLNNPLRRKKYQYRYLFLQRVHFHHQMRVVEYGSNRFSQLHQTTMEVLLQLSVSHYSEIRCLAQWVLGECYLRLPFSYRKILPQISDLIENVASLSHDKLKGLLHVLLNDQHNNCLLTRRDFFVLLKCWPVVLKTPISDRPSTNILLDYLCNKVSKTIDTFSITWEVPDRVLKAAEVLWSNGSEPRPAFPKPSEAEINEGLKRVQIHNDNNLRLYKEIVHQHITLMETPQLHWQNFQLGCEMLLVLIRHDTEFPVEGIRLLLNCLTNDSVVVRNTALRGIGRILYKLRPPCIRIENDASLISSIKKKSIYDDNHEAISTDEEWDNTVFLDQPHLGFYCWPKLMKVHAPAGKQKMLSRDDQDRMLESEKFIFDSFTSEAFLQQILKFLSAEVSKEHDKLGLHKCNVFKNLFRNYQDTCVDLLIPHVERLSKGTMDSEKRCALEIIAGMVSGSKHWKHAKLLKLEEALKPVIKSSLNDMTVELQGDWLRAIRYMTDNRDPRKNKWLIDLLLENLLSLNNGSFVETNRINLLCSILSEQVWKLPRLQNDILHKVQPHLAHAYQNVRDELGRLLSLLFSTYGNVPPFPNGHKGPCQKKFVESVLPKLEALEKSLAHVVLPAGQANSLDEDDEGCKTAISLLKTICRWIQRRLVKNLQFLSPEIIELLPALCQGENYDRDPELRFTCKLAIACIGFSYLSSEMIPIVLTRALQLSKSNSWRTRKNLLEYLQLAIFSNLFNMLQFPNIIDDIKQTVISLLHDVRPEVQQIAGLTLSGLFHNQMLCVDDSTLNSFKKWSETRIQKGKSAVATNGESLRQRHAGILGMSAIVAAHPYDITEEMPEILVVLGRHINDPQPLQTTVRFTITNFWRTHHDNWQDHKLKFTEDQLSDISDLLVSPSYYA